MPAGREAFLRSESYPAPQAMNTNPHFSDVEYLLDGFEHVETVAEFRDRLKLGRPLNVKLGIDPTSPDLHLGFMVVLEKAPALRRGRPRRNAHHRRFHGAHRRPERPERDASAARRARQIEANMQTYREQAGKVLDLERVEVRYNSEWLGQTGRSPIW